MRGWGGDGRHQPGSTWLTETSGRPRSLTIRASSSLSRRLRPRFDAILKSRIAILKSRTWSTAALLLLPTYCPRANPIERCFGDVHDKCTRNHRRKRIRDLVKDVDRHIEKNGPWKYKLSEIYYTPEVTAAVRKLEAAQLPEAM